MSRIRQLARHDTRVLHAKIGDYLTVVRQMRDSDEWFLGALIDEIGRTLQAPLGFLDRGREYVAEINRDADNADWRDNPTANVVEQRPVDANTVLRLRLAPRGGQAFVSIRGIRGRAGCQDLNQRRGLRLWARCMS